MEQSKQKYVGIEWEAEEEEDDQFKKLWHELGGDKLDEKEKQKKQPVVSDTTTVPKVREVAREPEE